MDTSPAPGAVVVGVDGSEHSDRAVAWAADQAHRESRTLILVHATGNVRGAGNADAHAGRVREELSVAGQELLDRAAAQVSRRLPDLRVQTAVQGADARQTLLELSQDAALLVVGSRGHGPVRSALLGSVSVGLARHSTCPVVVVRPHNPGLVRRGVLVGTDGTADAAPVLEFAYRHASEHDLPLTVLHSVWDTVATVTDPHLTSLSEPGLEDAHVRLAESVSGFAEKFPDVHVQQVVARGLPAATLLALADRMELVVVGRHQRSGLGNVLLGSVAASVVEHATCVVAVVPVETVPGRPGTNDPSVP